MTKDRKPRPAETAPPFRKARICACGEHGFVGLTKGFVTFVDPEDVPHVAPWLWSSQWTPMGGGRNKVYAARAHKKTTIRMHQTMVPGAERVDHIDGDTLNNRRSTNLRPATASQNGANSRRIQGSIPFKGVSVDGDLFRASVKGRKIGTFATPEAAARAYDRAALEAYGEYAVTNEHLGLYQKEAAE